MIIKLYSNRKVEPSSIIMANQHENMTRVLEFNLEQVPNGYRYLVLTNSSGSNLYLITDNKVDITSAFTWNGQTYEANVVVSNIELENELVSTNVLWISNTFRLQVRRNNINAEELSKLPIPPDLQMPYDKLLQLIEDVEGKLENGEFNGKDGVGIKSIEKTGSEGLVDTYTITLTDDSTFIYSVTNGRDGTDGKSAYELAVENGFKGTEQEWLASLDYEHSEEFEQLAEQVKNDAKKSASNASTASAAAQSAATNAGAALNSANAASQSAADASVSATQAQQAAQEAENSKTSAETASSNAQQSAQSAEENANKAQEIADGLDPTIFAIKETATGNPTIISDSAEWTLQKLNVYGQSKQDSTTGAQLLDPSLFEEDKTINGITYTTNEDGSVKVEGTATSSANKYLGEYIDIFENGQTYTCNLTQNGYGYTGGFNITYNDDRHDYLPTLTVDKSTMISIKPYIQVRTDVTKNETIYPMVNKGESILPFEPYTGGKSSPSFEYLQEMISKEVSEIKMTGKNLANIQEFEKVYDSKTFEAHYENDKITYSGADDWSGCSIVLNQTFEAGQYTIHAKGVVMIISDMALPSFEYNEYWNGKGYPYFYKFTQLNQKISFNSNIPFKIGFIGGDISTEKSTVSGTMEQIQIELSSEATSYEQHKEQTITLSDPITLRGIRFSGGSVTIDGKQYFSDVIKEKDGVIGVERDIGKLVFDGSDDEIWSVNSTDLTTCIRGEIYPPRNTTYPDLLIATGMFDKLKFLAAYRDDSEHGYCQSGIFIFIDKSRLSSLDADGLKAFLKSNNITTIFKVENSTFEPLPEEVQAQYKALKSYYPNTVIQSGAFNEVTYVADTKTWIENKLNGVTELALGIGGK